MSTRDVIKEFLKENNCNYYKTSGIGLDFKTIYYLDSRGFCQTVSGASYKDCLNSLQAQKAKYGKLD